MLSTTSCDSFLNIANETKEAQISKIDSQPIVSLDANGLNSSDYFGQFRDRLASNYGRAIVHTINKKLSGSKMQTGVSIAAKNINRVAADIKGGGNLPEIGSTHIRVTNENGEVEEFVLMLRPYFDSAEQYSAAFNGKTAAMKTGTTWLALGPDRFYVHEDKNGNELWPITFPAVSLSNTDQQITLTFNKDGFVSSSLNSAKATNQINSDPQPNIVFVEAVPVIGTNAIEPCYEPGPPECGNPPPPPDDDNGDGNRINHGGNGGAIGGPTAGYQKYFTINAIQLMASGDGDNYSELQIFVLQNDNYNHNFPEGWHFRFDSKWEGGPTGDYNTWNRGADGVAYYVSDVNMEGYLYDINPTVVGSGYPGVNVNGFPMFDLTHQPGPWRFVFSDDDSDYEDFSIRREDEYADDIWTYNMANGTYSEVYTGFTTDYDTWGHSDDPIRESGVRNITYNNFQERVGYSDFYLRIEKTYPDGPFIYRFSIKTY